MRTSISFTHAFLKSPLHNENQAGPSGAASPSPALMTYSPAQHGSVNQFLAHPDFVAFKQQYIQAIDSITAFVQAHADQLDPPLSAQQRNQVKEDFDVLKQHLFEGNFFNQSTRNDHRPEVYGPGKDMLDTLVKLLQDERIPLLKRMNAAVALSPRARMCSGGLLSDLQETVTELKTACQGIKGTAYQWKIKMLEALILEHVAAHHHYTRGDEIHYVNAYYNALAEEYGLQQRKDPYADNLQRNQGISQEQLALCKNQVSKKLKPTQLAMEVADQYRTRIEDALHQEQIAADSISDSDFRKLNTTLSTLQPEYGEVSPHHFLAPVDENWTQMAYTGAKKPTALARHFLKELKAQKIVDYEKKGALVLGHDGKGDRLKKLDDLFWIKDIDGQIQELTAQFLFKLPPQKLLQHIEKAEPEDARDRMDLLHAVLQRGSELLEAAGPAEETLLGTWLCDFAAEMKERQSWGPELSQPAVLLAARFNQAEALKALLDSGGDKDAREKDGKTALMLAVQSGHTEIAEILISHEANLNAADTHGNTALIYAALNNQVPVLRALLKTGADMTAMNNEGCPGLYLALGKGYAEAVRAFGEQVRLVPEAQRAELLAAQRADGVPGLYWALQNGHAEAVRAFGEQLELVPEAQRAELLAAKRADGVPGLYLALQNGHAEAVRAFGEQLKHVPQAQIAGLLAAKKADGFPALYVALENGHAAAVRAFGEQLKYVPEEQRAELLAAKDANENPGLHAALENGHAEAVRAFGEQLDQVPEEQRAELLAAKDEDELPGLYWALLDGHAEAVTAFGEQLSRVPQAQRAGLLAAKRADGLPGLFMDLQEGRTETVRAFGEQLKHVPQEQRADLLTPKTHNGESGLAMAKNENHHETVNQYIQTVMAIALGLSVQDRAVLRQYIKEAMPEDF